MCGGCNLLAESAGVSVIAARYWWVARQGRLAVAAAERIAVTAADQDAIPDFVDPLPELTRIAQ